MFDFDELDKLDSKTVLSSSNPILTKALAMKFRHKALGLKFRAQANGNGGGGACSKRASNPSAGSLSEPLASVHEDEAAEGSSHHFLDREGSLVEVVGTENMIGLKGIILHPFCTLLVCSPLGIYCGLHGGYDTASFWLNFLALVPLAKILGDATEELAAAIQNDTVSGLLNATFGNAVELIVSVQSLKAGLFTVVKASLLGSVLSNILLVLGMSFFLGGLTANKQMRGKFHSFKGPAEGWATRLISMEKEQKFPVKSAMISMAMLFFGCMVVVLPTLFDALPSKDSQSVLQVSRIGAWITISSYFMYLIFQLVTHSVTLAMSDKMLTSGASSRSLPEPRAEDVFDARHDDQEDDNEEESASIDSWVAVMLMVAVTVLVAFNSKFLVDTLQKTAESSGLSMGFIGVILLPVAGNACEHAAAVRFCMRDRPGLAIGIAVGSATQVALLVIPVSVLLGQAMGKDMDLNFGLLNVAVVFFTLIVVLVLLLDGRANWFKGYLLCALYVFISALYLYVPPGFGDDSTTVQ